MRWRIKGRAEERFSLSLAELMLLEEATRPLPAVRPVPLVLAAYRGLRRGEAMGHQRRDFNRAHGSFKIERNATHGPISTPKTDRSTRTVSVPAFLVVESAALIDAQKLRRSTARIGSCPTDVVARSTTMWIAGGTGCARTWPSA